MSQMKAVILAGGFGTRLSEETDLLPKPMVQIGGRPIIWHIMKIYGHHGITDFVVCLGYKAHMFKEFFANYYFHSSDLTVDLRSREIEIHQNTAEPWRVTLVDTGLDTMTGGRIKRVAAHLDGTFCLTYGDGVANIDVQALLQFHKSHGKLATVTAVAQPSRFGILEIQDDTVHAIREKSDSDGSVINGGFFVFERKVFDYIADDQTVLEREPLERLARDGQLAAYHHTGFWQPMDTLRDKRLLDDLCRDGRAPWMVWK
jgi:glucose-1-phosphate cytidylyltransferase